LTQKKEGRGQDPCPSNHVASEKSATSIAGIWESNTREPDSHCGARNLPHPPLRRQYLQIVIENELSPMAQTASDVQLKKATLESFSAYIRDAEAAMERNTRGQEPFLWAEASAERAQEVREGQIAAEFWSGHGPIKVPDGLIHDWIGAAWAPKTTLAATLALIQDYDNHWKVYTPEVLASKLVKRRGNDFQIYLRLLKKKILTVVLETDHRVIYRPLSRTHWACWSHSTRIAEVQNAGESNERVLPPDTGHGFLWRLNSYWQFRERDGGVDLECRAISLSRNVPFGLGWLIEPIIQKLPKESLIHTLECTRQALLAKTE